MTIIERGLCLVHFLHQVLQALMGTCRNPRTMFFLQLSTSNLVQLMLLSKKAVKAALATRPQEYEALQAKARVLYQAHLSRSSRWERPDILNDSTFALLRTSLSLSRDIQIEGNQPSSSQTDGPGPVDSSGGHDRFSGIDNCLPLLARPTHDRPRTFD